MEMDEVDHHLEQLRIRLLERDDLFFGVVGEGLQPGRVLGDEFLADLEVQPITRAEGIDIMHYFFLRRRRLDLRDVDLLLGSHRNDYNIMNAYKES